MKYIIIFSLLLSLISCQNKQDNPAPQLGIDKIYQLNDTKISISTGMAGTLTLAQGNCMPTIGSSNSCSVQAVKRTIWIYPYLTMNDVKVKDYTFFTINNPSPFKVITTDEEGFYQVSLSAGRYSVFIEDNGQLYANRFNSDGGINPIEVETGKVSKANLKLDYAVY